MGNATLTLDKVKRLAQYVAANAATVDPEIELTIDKLLGREAERLIETKQRLVDQLAEFERQ